VILITPAIADDNQLTDEEKSQGWILLFDGKTLAGWKAIASSTQGEFLNSKRPVDQGSLNPHRCGGYMLIHTKMWSDFVLSLDFKPSPGCNSGVFFRVFPLRSQPGKDIGYNGLEVAIDDTHSAGYVDTGALYDLAKPTTNAQRPIGQWNHLVLTCQGTHVTVDVNGERVNSVELADFDQLGRRPDGTDHKFGTVIKDHPRHGFIGLQDHGADIWFKNIKILPRS
jgi:hypothetical protein